MWFLNSSLQGKHISQCVQGKICSYSFTQNQQIFSKFLIWETAPVQWQPDKAWRIFGTLFQCGSSSSSLLAKHFHIECKEFDSYPKAENHPGKAFHVFSINLRNSSRGSLLTLEEYLVFCFNLVFKELPLGKTCFTLWARKSILIHSPKPAVLFHVFSIDLWNSSTGLEQENIWNFNPVGTIHLGISRQGIIFRYFIKYVWEHGYALTCAKQVNLSKLAVETVDPRKSSEIDETM